jgi:glycosyltransferase involved in cell wall biosynthesis
MVAYNFVDLDHFSAAEDYGDGHPGRQIVAWIGRIDPLKNWQDFLKIADRLVDRPNVEFWMVGGGGSADEARTEFRKALAGTRVAPKLRWWPLLDSEAMLRLYPSITSSGGTMLLTTKNESFGFAALETMASGCPLVAAAVGALPEIISDGETGHLYPSGDVEAAAARVAELLDGSELREKMGRTAAKVTRERFAPEKCLADFAAAVKKVASTEAP